MTQSTRLTAAGQIIARYGVVVVLLGIGSLKFTAAEAEGIRRLIETSPLMSWMYSVWSVQGASNITGVVEIIAAVLIAVRPVSARACIVGSAVATVTFLTTLSFMVTAPGVWDEQLGFPALGGAGQFLIKDLVLLGASVWSLGEALEAARRNKLPLAS